MSSTNEESAAPATAAVHLHAHSNENLLKIDTHDKFSTISTIKKKVMKDLSIAADTQPMLPGLVRANKNPRNTYMFMAFDTPEHRAAAAELLVTVHGRGEKWVEVPVTAADQQVTHKGQSGERSRKREREQAASGADGAQPKVAAFAHLSMEEQLDRKKGHCLKVMKAILPSRVYGWKAHTDRFQGVLQSPEWTGYRNHAQLSFGYTSEGVPALGFWAGAMVDGHATVVSVVGVPGNRDATVDEAAILTLHPVSRVIAEAVMSVVKTTPAPAEGSSAPVLPVFDKQQGTGFWRKVQVRHNVYGEAMVDVEVDPSVATPEQLKAVEQALVEVLTGAAVTAELVALTPSLYGFRKEQPSTGSSTTHAPASPRVVSVQLHHHTGIRSLPIDAPREVLFGSSTFTEYISVAGSHEEGENEEHKREAKQLSFAIGPTTFFQVNTGGLEKMLAAVTEAAELSPTTTLLDLCSGVGTLGIGLAHRVRQVIGIELVAEAVEKAKENVERNGVTNATYHAGRVEDLLPSLLSKLPVEHAGDIVAILDPPRAGVGSVVLKWVRGTAAIKRVVYISCEQKALERDCPLLTKPPTKAYRGCPFEVSSGVAVDMFPHTPHVEMFAVMTRKEGEDDGAVTVQQEEPSSSS